MFSLGQNLEPVSVFILDDCKCEKFQSENKVLGMYLSFSSSVFIGSSIYYSS